MPCSSTSPLSRCLRAWILTAGVLGMLRAFAPGQTTVTISGEDFHINGKPTYEGRMWKGHRIEGLLMNARMVQGTFDDLNPDTVGMWAYPDTGKWDAERNVNEFIAAMPEWRTHGMLSFTLNLQGGSPQGYSNKQPWHNSAFESDGQSATRVHGAHGAHLAQVG